MGRVTPLHPIRVLLAGPDRRYLRAAGELLAQSGYVTKATEKTTDVPPLAEQWRASVVVLDATGQVTRTLRTAAALQAGGGNTGILVVADLRDARRACALPKWDVLDELALAVERTYLAGSSQIGGTVATG